MPVKSPKKPNVLLHESLTLFNHKCFKIAKMFICISVSCSDVLFHFFKLQKVADFGFSDNFFFGFFSGFRELIAYATG